MSTWDTHIFSDEASVELLRDVDDLEAEELMEALQDAVTIASDQATPGQSDYTQGLCAASIAAVWCGAPFAASNLASEHAFVRAYIGRCPEELQEAAFELLDAELARLGEDSPEGLDTYAEAVS